MKTFVLAIVAALSLSTSAYAQDRVHLTVEQRTERHVEHRDRYDRHDRHERREHRMHREDRGHHYGHNRYHCHNVKKVVYRDGERRVVWRKKCHSARH